MFEELVTQVTKRSKGETKKADDLVDRLNHRYTVIILVVFAGLIIGKVYVAEEPITCWAPTEFEGSWIEYVNSFCWVSNTYYLPFEEEIPKEREDHLRHKIVYYQWVPFLMLVQAALFYFPSVVWTGLNQTSGVDTDDILDAARRCQLPPALLAKKEEDEFDKRQKLPQLIAKLMDRFLGGRGMSCYLVVLYLFSKALYILNVIGQFFLLDKFLGFNFHTFGIEVIRNIKGDFDSDYMWGDTKSFPRVTMCDFKIRRVGNVHRYTVQCLLQINLYTEKAYAVLWFWMVFIVIVSCLSFLQWLIRALSQRDRINYIQHHLAAPGRINLDDEGDQQMLREFVTEYLRQDGVFILRMISSNTNYVTSTEIICAVYDNWLKHATEEYAYDSDDEDDQEKVESLV